MFVKQRVQANVRVVVALAVGLAVIMSLILSSHSFAADTAANTLKVSPVRSDVSIDPGKSKTVQITVTNITSASATVSPIENDFISGDENGTPSLILDADKYAPTHSLKRFMTPLTTVTIPAGKSITVNVVITVPSTAQAGGYFGAVRFAPTDPDGGGQVNLSGSVASLILLTVTGPTTEQLDLTDFNVQQNGKTNNFFTTPDNLSLAIRFQNKGNVQLAPFGKISVQKNKKVIYSADFNNDDPRDEVLPDSARKWSLPLDKVGKFGHYNVVATFTYGSKNQTLDISKSFWVIPMSYIIAAIAAVVVIIIVVILIIVLSRGRRRRSLRRHSFGRR